MFGKQCFYMFHMFTCLFLLPIFFAGLFEFLRLFNPILLMLTYLILYCHSFPYRQLLHLALNCVFLKEKLVFFKYLAPYFKTLALFL